MVFWKYPFCIVPRKKLICPGGIIFAAIVVLNRKKERMKCDDGVWLFQRKRKDTERIRLS